MKNESKAAIPEPAPTGEGEIVLEWIRMEILEQKAESNLGLEILKDLEARAEEGKKKYGTYLRVNNGRDALNDLYEEILDAIMYAEQYKLERRSANFSFSIGGALLSLATVVKAELNSRQADPAYFG